MVVWEWLARPSIHRLPSQKADDIGARLGVPSGFKVEIRTTGVPQYRMGGEIAICAIMQDQIRRLMEALKMSTWRSQDQCRVHRGYTVEFIPVQVTLS